MKHNALRYVCLFLFLGSAPASAELLHLTESRFVAEPFVGMVFPMSDLVLNDSTGLQSDSRWGTRIQFGGAIAMRVWDPLHLDAGIRLGLSFQNRLEVNANSKSYDPSIKMFEFTPYARGHIYPLGTEEWGISFELGLGMLIAGGGKMGSTEEPENAQSSLRIRVALGAIWRYKEAMAITFDVLSLVTDIAITDEWDEKVGNIISLEPRFGWQVRF
jgi:hypothetical protein